MTGGTIGGATTAEGNINDNGGGVYVGYFGTFTMTNGAVISGNSADSNNYGGYGGGVYVAAPEPTISYASGGTFQISGGIVYGSDGSPNQNITTTSTGEGAALYNSGTAQYGTFAEGTDNFTSKGDILPSSQTTRETTFWVEDGELKP
jgi:hypothetical protein